MTIRVICTNCDALLRAPRAIAGKRVRCKKCGGVFVASPVGEDDATLPETVKFSMPPTMEQAPDEDPTEEESPLKFPRQSKPGDDDDDTAVMESLRT